MGAVDLCRRMNGMQLYMEEIGHHIIASTARYFFIKYYLPSRDYRCINPIVLGLHFEELSPPALNQPIPSMHSRASFAGPRSHSLQMDCPLSAQYNSRVCRERPGPG